MKIFELKSGFQFLQISDKSGIWTFTVPVGVVGAGPLHLPQLLLAAAAVAAVGLLAAELGEDEVESQGSCFEQVYSPTES